MNSPALLAREGYNSLQILLDGRPKSEFHLLTDVKVWEYCGNRLLEQAPALHGVNLTVVAAGETSKTLSEVEKIGLALTRQGMSRKGLLINFGGGMVSDLGAFTASVYKRGIAHVNIPTTLLAQTDAALGGKTAVNLGPIKNALGTFHWPVLTVLDSNYLATLPANELQSGWAETIKHALIADAQLFAELEALTQLHVTDALLKTSAQIKLDIVARDPHEHGLRKALNFGHTVGHAFEGFFMDGPNALSHGEAVAQGMKIEMALALHLDLIAETDANRAFAVLNKWYGPITIRSEWVDLLLALMMHDKKNNAGLIGFALPTAIGQVNFEVKVEAHVVREVLAQS